MGSLRLRAASAAFVLVLTACGASSGSDVAASAGSDPTTTATPATAAETTDAPTTAAPTTASPTTGTSTGETLATADSPSSTSEPTTTAVPTTTAAPTTAAPTTTTAAAPAGDLVNLVGGGQLDLNSVEGTDTVLWFWAPW